MYMYMYMYMYMRVRYLCIQVLHPRTIPMPLCVWGAECWDVGQGDWYCMCGLVVVVIIIVVIVVIMMSVIGIACVGW